MNVIQYIIVYLIIVNILGFLFMGADKRRAKKRTWRIPESTLFILAVIGGSLGSIVGMYVFRHKTRHWYFVVGMPLILIIQVALVVLIHVSPIDIVFL